MAIEYEFVNPLGVEGDQIKPPLDFAKDRIYQTQPGSMFYVNNDSVMMNLDVGRIEIHTYDRVHNTDSPSQPFNPIPVMHVYDLVDASIRGFLLDLRYHDRVYEAERSDLLTAKIGAEAILGAIFRSQGAYALVPPSRASVLAAHAHVLISFTDSGQKKKEENVYGHEQPEGTAELQKVSVTTMSTGKNVGSRQK